MTSQQDSFIAAWGIAIERWREARHALSQWRATNPYPSADILPEDYDEAAKAVSLWERGNDRFASASGDAVDALVALPAPDIEAVMVKLRLARDALAEEIEDRVAPVLEAIERDLHRLSAEQTLPD